MRRLKKRFATRIIISVMLMLTAFSIIIGVLESRGLTNALLDQYAEDAFRTADIAATIVNADDIPRYIESEGKTPEYYSAMSNLSRLCNTSGATFIYVIVPDTTDYEHITFIFSAMNMDADYTQYDFGYYRETTNDDYREKYRKLYETVATEELVVRDKGYIETDAHITAMKALQGSDNKTKAILCVQRQMDVLMTARNSFINVLILILALAALFVGTIMSIYLDRTVITPITMITDEASRFAEENVLTGDKLADNIANIDEIGILATSIDKMEEQVIDYVEDLTKATADKERISTELGLASRIQSGMLPAVFPPFPDRHEFDIYASMKPAREVGGDFYNFFFVDEDHLCLMIADVSGKGVPGALFMMSSMIMLYNLAKLVDSPAQILKDMNDQINLKNKEEMFVTVWLGILDVRTGVITAANAGHEYPFFMGPDGRFELIKDKHGLVIGAMPGMNYTEYEMKMEPGSKLFVYTDGVPEATSIDNQLFGTDRTLEALNEARAASPEEIINNVDERIQEFVGTAEQFDDITMLCFEYRGTQV